MSNLICDNLGRTYYENVKWMQWVLEGKCAQPRVAWVPTRSTQSVEEESTAFLPYERSVTDPSASYTNRTGVEMELQTSTTEAGLKQHDVALSKFALTTTTLCVVVIAYNLGGAYLLSKIWLIQTGFARPPSGCGGIFNVLEVWLSSNTGPPVYVLSEGRP
ncbi:hypothetical protein Bbelb_057870 [Branchiostoma belcheri]|nr:hypothetical protein Bbelb_057870 [Branchiostoma belcheri]